MKKNKLVKISAIIAAALLISACSTNVRGPQEKIAVINWEQAVSAHPQYAKLEQGEKILQDLLNKRKGQEELAKAQLSSLNKLRSLRQLSQQSFMEADFNTRMVEQREIENAKLQKFAAQAEAEANAAVRADTPVRCWVPDPETLAHTEYRSKKELDGPVRLVEAGGDCCACCGTHLARTGEVGLIKIISAQHYKTGMRLAVACGQRAYDAVAAICADAEAAGRVLSAPAGSLTPSVENRQNGEAVLKQRIAALQNALADAYVQAAAPDRPAVLWAEGADGDGLRRIAMAVCAGTNQVACALAPGGQGLSYALAAPDGTDARALGRALNEAFAGRGGGKPAFCQGSLAQPGLTPDVVREKLSTLL